MNADLALRFVDGVAGGFLLGWVVILLIVALTIGFDPADRGQRALSQAYCTDFAPHFVIASDGTWECVEAR